MLLENETRKGGKEEQIGREGGRSNGRGIDDSQHKLHVEPATSGGK